MSLISLTYTASGDAFYLDDENIIRVYSLSSETRVEYADVEAGISRTVVVDESVSTVGGSSNILIALTETASGATFYLNSNKISSVLTEGTGSLIYFDVLGKKSQVVVDEAKSAVEAITPNTNAPYKVWRGLITQTGTDEPTAIVLENTLSGDLTWSYSSAGVYVATLVGEFTADKTFIFTGQVAPDTVVSTNRIDVDSITVRTYDISSAGFTDVRLSNNSLEIRVYP
jgi:hypothetical protein